MYRRCAVRLTPRAAAPISRFMVEPSETRTFEQTLEQCKAEKVDMAARLSSEFLSLQAKLIPYRIARLSEEVQYVVKHPFGSFPSFPNLVLHCLLLPIVFVLCLYAGRQSTTPLIAPPAPAAAAEAPSTPEAGATPAKA